MTSRIVLKFSLLLIVFAISLLCSLMFGYHHFSLVDLSNIFFSDQHVKHSEVLFKLRVPRTIIAMIVGMLLGISGLMIQTITRNPFASPGIMGINSGASLCVVCAIVIFNIDGTFQLSMISFMGAFIVAVMIVLTTLIPVKPLNIMELTLFGASISAFCMAVTQGILIYNESAIEQVIYWLSGSVSNRKLSLLGYLWPFIFMGIVLTIFNIKYLNLFILDDATMTSIGGNIVTIKLLVMATVALLSGVAVALAGPIAFIGLITPHITKLLIRTNHHLILLTTSAVIGAIILVLSDILSRFILFPQEIPVGIATSIIGAPIFFLLILKRKEHLV